MKPRTLTCEDPDTSAIIDNIGACPFVLTAKWDTKTKKLEVIVEVSPGDLNPNPVHRLLVDIDPKQVIP